MKGIVFNLLEEAVTRSHGAATWDALLVASGVGGVYTSLGSYPDEDVLKLVMAASNALGVTPNEVLRWFGREAMPLLAQRYPAFFDAHKSTRPFLLSLNSIIHPEVRKIYPGADVPTFDFEDAADGALIMGVSLRAQVVLAGAGIFGGRRGALRRDHAVRSPGLHAQGRSEVHLPHRAVSAH